MLGGIQKALKKANSKFRKTKYIFNRGARPALRAVVCGVTSSQGQLKLVGRVYANFSVKELQIIVRKFRQEQLQFKSAVELVPCIGFYGLILAVLSPLLGLRCYKFSVELRVPWVDLPSSIYSLAVQSGGARAQIMLPAGVGKTIVNDEENYTLFVFKDPVVRAARIEHYKFGSQGLRELDQHAAVPRPLDLSCVIAEYTNSARDNGLALFQHIEANEPSVLATYIVERENHDRFPIDGNRIVEFGTLEHLKRCLDAQVVAFSHHRAYAYPMILRSINQSRYDSARTLFLQHGVTALKRSVQRFYRRGRCGYTAVSVCSELERRIFREAFGYAATEVFVTGFPRHDALFLASRSHAKEESILVFPTWRGGLEKMQSQEAADTIFVAQWRAALSELRSAGLHVKLMLHPIIHRHAGLFENYCDVMVPASAFQAELLKSRCLVTDYSSVSFDALYADIPVVMFQFDIEDYGLRQDAFIDVETQLPGLPTYDSKAVMEAVMALRSNGWRVGAEQHRDLYFDRRDASNGDRVVSVIKALALTSG